MGKIIYPFFGDKYELLKHRAQGLAFNKCTCCLIIFKKFIGVWLLSVQFSSVAQSCPTLCDPRDCSTPGLPVHHQLLEFTQAHVHWVSDAIQPSHPLSSPSPPAFSLSQHQGLFHWVRSLHQVATVYSCFTMLLVSTLWQTVSAIHLYMYPLFLGVPFHLGHRRTLSRVPCATQQVLISYLFYAWYQ